MKTRNQLILLTSLLLSTLTLPATEQQKWQTNWTEFGKELVPIIEKVEKPGVTEKDIDRVFDDKQVEWEGEVAKVSPPDARQKFGRILVKMTPVRLAPGGSSIQLDDISLTPQDDQEWKSWADVKEATRVSFRTKLKSPNISGMAVVWVFYGAVPNGGKARVILGTEGATMVRAISTDTKKSK
jgi:hypothetical protein